MKTPLMMGLFGDLREVYGEEAFAANADLYKARLSRKGQIARLDKLLDAQETLLKKAFIDAVGGIRGSIVLERVVEMVSGGRLDDAIFYLDDVVPGFYAKLAEARTNAYMKAGKSAAAEVQEAIPHTFARFNVVNERAVEAMRANEVRLIREISESQRNSVWQAMNEGVKAGKNPREIARNYRDAIGLTSRQEAAVRNYRRGLEQGDTSISLGRKLRDHRFDSTVARAAKERKPLPQTRINGMVERYRERMVKHRSEVIGRTEGLRAVNEGSNDLWTQLAEEGGAGGVIRPEAIRRKWHTAGDHRVRASHRSIPTLNPEGRAIGEPFITPQGPLLYPGDPAGAPGNVIQCRCVVTVEILTDDQLSQMGLDDIDPVAPPAPKAKAKPRKKRKKRKRSFRPPPPMREGVNESPLLDYHDDVDVSGVDLDDVDIDELRLQDGVALLPRTATDAEFNKKFVRAEERRIKKHIDVIKAALLKDDPFIDKEMLNAELKLREQSLDDLSKGKYFDSLLGEDADAFVKNRIDEMNVFTAVSPAKFDAVLKTGRFKNIHEVTDDDLALGGEGGLAYDDPASRAHAERKLFGVDDGATDVRGVAEDPDKFPVYGFMSKGDEVSPHSRINGFGYGDIMVRFRNDTTRDRTTVTIGDSLNNSIGDTVGVGTSKRAVPVSNPSRELLYGADDAIDDKEKLRLMKQVLKKDTDEWTADLIYKDGDVEEMVSTKDFYYLETQMYGEVSTRDIAEVFVTSKVDAVKIRKQLDDAGLQHVKISARKYDDRFRFGYSNNKQSLIYKRTMSLSDDDFDKLGDSYLPTIFNAYVRTMDDGRLAVTWDIDDLPVGKEIFTKRGVESLKIRSDSNEKYPTLTDRYMSDKRLTPDAMREWLKVARKHLIKNDPDAKDYMSGEAWTDTVIDKNLFKDLHYYIRNPDAKPDLDEVFMARIQGEASPEPDLPKPKPVKAKPSPVAPIDGIEPLPGRLSEVRARPYLKEMQAGTEFMHPQGIVGSDGKKYYLDGEPVTRREMLDLLMSKDDWGGVNESPSLEPDLSDADVARLKAGKKVLPRTVTDAKFNAQFVKNIIDDNERIISRSNPTSGNTDEERAAKLNKIKRLKQTNIDLKKGKYLDDLLGEDVDAFVKNRVDEMNNFMAISPAKLDAVLKGGKFKNRHQVTDEDLALSDGEGLKPDGKRHRASVERRLFGVDDGAKDVTDFAKDPDKFPVYGFMSKGDEVSPHSRINGFGYGDIMVRFRNDTTRDRTTVTIGDSLHNAQGGAKLTQAHAVPVTNPSRALLYGIEKHIEGDLLKKTLKKDTDEWTSEYKLNDKGELENTSYMYYFETQMYGEVSIRDIAEISVTSKVDAVKIRKQLDDAGLQHVKISARKYDDRLSFERKQVESDDPFGGGNFDRKDPKHIRAMSLSDDDIAKLGDSYLPTIFNAYMRTFNGEFWYERATLPKDLPAGKSVLTKHGVKNLKINYVVNKKHPSITDMVMEDAKLTPDVMREWIKVARKNSEAKEAATGEPWLDTVLDKNLLKDLHYYIRTPDAKPDLDEAFMASVRGDTPTAKPKAKPAKPEPVTPPKAVDPPAPPAPAPVSPTGGATPLPGRLSEIKARPYLKEMQGGTAFAHPKGVLTSDGKKYYLDGAQINRKRVIELMISRDEWADVPTPTAKPEPKPAPVTPPDPDPVAPPAPAAVGDVEPLPGRLSEIKARPYLKEMQAGKKYSHPRGVLSSDGKKYYLDGNQIDRKRVIELMISRDEWADAPPVAAPKPVAPATPPPAPKPVATKFDGGSALEIADDKYKGLFTKPKDMARNIQLLIDSRDDADLDAVKQHVFGDDGAPLPEVVAKVKFSVTRTGYSNAFFRNHDKLLNMREQAAEVGDRLDNLSGHFNNVVMHEFGHSLDYNKAVLDDLGFDTEPKTGTQVAWGVTMSEQYTKELIDDLDGWVKGKSDVDDVWATHKAKGLSDKDTARAMDDELEKQGAPRIIGDFINTLGDELKNENDAVGKMINHFYNALTTKRYENLGEGLKLMGRLSRPKTAVGEGDSRKFAQRRSLADDFFASATTNANGSFRGHTNAYYRKRKTIGVSKYGDISAANTSEMFANYFWARTSADPLTKVLYKVMKHAMPRTIEKYDGIIRQTGKTFARVKAEGGSKYAPTMTDAEAGRIATDIKSGKLESYETVGGTKITYDAKSRTYTMGDRSWYRRKDVIRAIMISKPRGAKATDAVNEAPAYERPVVDADKERLEDGVRRAPSTLNKDDEFRRDVIRKERIENVDKTLKMLGDALDNADSGKPFRVGNNFHGDRYTKYKPLAKDVYRSYLHQYLILKRIRDQLASNTLADDIVGGDADAFLKERMDGMDSYMAVRDLTTLRKIAKDGRFKNSLEVGRGTFATAGEDRVPVEREVFNVTADSSDYQSFPKYGFLSDSNEIDVNSRMYGFGYGEIMVKFRRDTTRARSTLTYGDSFNNNRASRWRAPSVPLENPTKDLFIDYHMRFEKMDVKYQAEHELAREALHETLSTKTDDWVGKQLVTTDKGKYSNFGSEYFETQIYGDLTLDDVAEVFVTSIKDAKGVRKILDDRGLHDVEIRVSKVDGRLDFSNPSEDPKLKTGVEILRRMMSVSKDDLPKLGDMYISELFGLYKQKIGRIGGRYSSDPVDLQFGSEIFTSRGIKSLRSEKIEIDSNVGRRSAYKDPKMSYEAMREWIALAIDKLPELDADFHKKWAGKRNGWVDEVIDRNQLIDWEFYRKFPDAKPDVDEAVMRTVRFGKNHADGPAEPARPPKREVKPLPPLEDVEIDLSRADKYDDTPAPMAVVRGKKRSTLDNDDDTFVYKYQVNVDDDDVDDVINLGAITHRGDKFIVGEAYHRRGDKPEYDTLAEAELHLARDVIKKYPGLNKIGGDLDYDASTDKPDVKVTLQHKEGTSDFDFNVDGIGSMKLRAKVLLRKPDGDYLDDREVGGYDINDLTYMLRSDTAYFGTSVSDIFVDEDKFEFLFNSLDDLKQYVEARLVAALPDREIVGDIKHKAGVKAPDAPKPDKDMLAIAEAERSVDSFVLLPTIEPRTGAPEPTPTPAPVKPEPVKPPTPIKPEPEPVKPPVVEPDPDPVAPPSPAAVVGDAEPLPGRLSEIKARPYLKEMQAGKKYSHPRGVLSSDGKKYYLDGSQIDRKRVIELMISREEWADTPAPTPVSPPPAPTPKPDKPVDTGEPDAPEPATPPTSVGDITITARMSEMKARVIIREMQAGKTVIHPQGKLTASGKAYQLDGDDISRLRLIALLSDKAEWGEAKPTPTTTPDGKTIEIDGKMSEVKARVVLRNLQGGATYARDGNTFTSNGKHYFIDGEPVSRKTLLELLTRDDAVYL